MGMIRKYSSPLYDMAEHFVSIECDCDRRSDDNEWCEICGTADFLTKQAKEVCKFEREVDEMIKENRKLKTELHALAALIHYPEHWDTATYPTLATAIREIGCSECKN